jgi:hypothetical protein
MRRVVVKRMTLIVPDNRNIVSLEVCQKNSCKLQILNLPEYRDVKWNGVACKRTEAGCGDREYDKSVCHLNIQVRNGILHQ